MRGSFDRPPSPEEIETMRLLVQRGMEEGAVGVSTGLIYLPGVFAKTEEIIELAKVAARYDGIYATHQRSESGEIFQSLDEIFRIAREARIRAEVSHIKLSGPSAWGKADKVIAAIEQARAEGPRHHSGSVCLHGVEHRHQPTRPRLREGGRSGEVPRAHGEPRSEGRHGCADEGDLAEAPEPRLLVRSHRFVQIDPSFNGLNLVEAAMKMHGADTLDDQIETILEIEKKGGASGVFPRDERRGPRGLHASPEHHVRLR
jgi:N-acyl-D-amino-acid deacylase